MVEQLIDDRAAPPTCVWMDAGLLTYKLCSRDFDCEHCPLDAALRGTPMDVTIERIPPRRLRTSQKGYPTDRLYCNGHTWLRPLGEGELARFGIDSFAASLMPEPEHVRAVASPCFVHRQSPLCEIECGGGLLTIESPIDARVVRWNSELTDNAPLVASDPYDDGWIVELWPVNANELHTLGSTQQAEASARLDFRRFLRRVGQELLLESVPREGRGTNGHVATDLRRIIGGARLISMLRDFIH